MLKYIALLSFAMGFMATPQASGQLSRIAFVDKNGILRWSDNQQEITGFGTNYTLPFAYAYRNALKKGLDPEKLIDGDVYQFARLGFDLFRVHVWDTEISDTFGNLLENEHLRLFDYLLFKLKERGIRSIITPIAYWGNGWPESDTYSPGFSHRYGKDSCLTNADAIIAQQLYLKQFIAHRNPYTGLAYKDDDDIIAIEICNEPHHRASTDSVRSFINGMAEAIRSTGCKKPILYNISHSIQSAPAYFTSAIQGGSFQWYPTGLGAKHELKGNFLPHTDRYSTPYEKDSAFRRMAKIVYEFDAADIGRSYIYPAMARSFRTAGMQLATHFAYDPTYSAYANTEYGTHYMNLLYAPQKALSLMIAGEVFRRVPLYKSYGSYPIDTLFDNFLVSYPEDLSVLAANDKYIYTNHTTKAPQHPEQLSSIAGYGNSPLVKYDGKGAYFLDKIRTGVWRLEVLPDAIWVNDPFAPTRLDKAVAILEDRNHYMKLELPDLGNRFYYYPIDKKNKRNLPIQRKNGIAVLPGVYILSSQKSEITSLLSQSVGQLKMAESISRYGIVTTNADSLKLSQLEGKPHGVATSTQPGVLLFDAQRDSEHLIKEWRKGSALKEDPDGKYSWETKLTSLQQRDPEFPAAELPTDYCFQLFIGDRILPLSKSWSDSTLLNIEGYSTDATDMPIQVSLTDFSGNAFGCIIRLPKIKSVISIPLRQLRLCPLVLLPRPYPGFLPYFFTSASSAPFKLEKSAQLQISIGPGIPPDMSDKPYSFRISRVWINNH